MSSTKTTVSITFPIIFTTFTLSKTTVNGQPSLVAKYIRFAADYEKWIDHRKFFLGQKIAWICECLLNQLSASVKGGKRTNLEEG